MLFTVSKNALKMIGHHARIRDVTGHYCTQFMPALVLIKHVINQSKFYFVVAGRIIYWSNTWEKNQTGRKCQAYGEIWYEICLKITPFKMTWM